MIILNAR